MVTYCLYGNLLLAALTVHPTMQIKQCNSWRYNTEKLKTITIVFKHNSVRYTLLFYTNLTLLFIPIKKYDSWKLICRHQSKIFPSHGRIHAWRISKYFIRRWTLQAMLQQYTTRKSESLMSKGFLLHVIHVRIMFSSRLTFTCSKSTIETVKEGVKYVWS